MKLGTQELIIILIVVIIIFGPTQIPKLTKMFGKSVKSFKEGVEETEEDVEGSPKKVKKAKKKPPKNNPVEDIQKRLRSCGVFFIVSAETWE